jgi:fructose/tagatose bisphosphate aldolase
MVDRSAPPYEENIRDGAEIVEIAHAVGVSVGTGLGHVRVGLEHISAAGLTHNEETVEFVERRVRVGRQWQVQRAMEFDLLTE